MLRPMGRHVIVAGLVLLLTATLTACGDDDHGTADTSARSNPGASTTGSAAEDVATSEAAEITATTDSGDSVDVSVGLGTPAPLTDSPGALDICGGTISTTDQQRALAIPVSLNMRVTSSMTAAVTISLAESAIVDNGAAYLSMDTQGWYWAAAHSFGDSCERPGDYNSSAGLSHWDAAEPGSGHDTHAWLIVPDEISPDNPTGEDGKASRVVLLPRVSISDSSADNTYAESPYVVDCKVGDPAAPSTELIAIDPSGALQAGCTS